VFTSSRWALRIASPPPMQGPAPLEVAASDRTAFASRLAGTLNPKEIHISFETATATFVASKRPELWEVPLGMAPLATTSASDHQDSHGQKDPDKGTSTTSNATSV